MSWKYSKERIKKNKSKYIKYKKGLCCSNCGVKDYRVLDLHHLKDKKGNVIDLIYQGYSWITIEKEINKCVPLCSNCHRIKHWNQN
mgnify:FL=1